MNDLKDLFELALAAGDGPAPGQSADPAADLARGRRRLRRRRLAGLAGVSAAVLCGALVPLALPGSASPGHPAAAGHRPTPVAQPTHPQPAHPRPTAPKATPRQAHKIALVAWVGTEPPGYLVSWMPKGWVVQGSTPYVLVMASPRDPDKSPDSFLGKLVVMLQSADAPGPPTQGAPQPVNGRPGRFDVQGDTQILTFQVAGGKWVVIQAPVSLGWDSAELAKFASGVRVLDTAQAGRG